MCEMFNSAANAFMVIATTLAAFIPGAGAALSGGTKATLNGVKTAAGKGMAAAYVAKTACDGVQDFLENGTVSWEEVGAPFGLDQVGKLVDTVFVGGEEENPFQKDFDAIKWQFDEFTSGRWW